MEPASNEVAVTIHKFPLLQKTVIELPEYFQVLRVGGQNDTLMVWIELELDAPKIPYTFWVLGTGDLVKENTSHVGSAIMPPFVWHVYFEWNKDDDD